MTRNGKIARLPLAIRNTLGQRLREGEYGKNLVDWLNNLPEVQTLMNAEFSGRPVTEQNLSEWKTGGYVDWLRHQEAREWAGQLREQAADLDPTTTTTSTSATATHILESPLSDAVSTLLTVTLGRWVENFAAKAPEDMSAQDRRDLIGLAREFTRLRRADQRAGLLRLHQARRADILRKEKENRAATEAYEKKWKVGQWSSAPAGGSSSVTATPTATSTPTTTNNNGSPSPHSIMTENGQPKAENVEPIRLNPTGSGSFFAHSSADPGSHSQEWRAENQHPTHRNPEPGTGNRERGSVTSLERTFSSHL